MADATDALIRKAMAEDEQERKQRKQHKGQLDDQRRTEHKGKTFGEIEEEENGPIHEAAVPMAAAKRAAKRKAGSLDDTSTEVVAVEDLHKAEEELQIEQEEGVSFEPFNMKEERKLGQIDAQGNFIAREKVRKGEDDEDEDEEEDAWLTSEAATLVSDKVRESIATRLAREQQEGKEAAAPPSATQVARLQLRASAMLNPGESVVQGLRRWGIKLEGDRRRRRRAKGAEGESLVSAVDKAEARKAVEELTSVADALMESGENDVYSKTKEYFKQAAAVLIDVDESDEEDPLGTVATAGRSVDSAPAAAPEDDDVDMFGEEHEPGPNLRDGSQQDNPAPSRKGESGSAAEPGKIPPPPGLEAPGGRGTQEEEDDAYFDEWPVKELRRYLAEQDVDAAGIVEKADLIARVKETARAHSSVAAPPGYAFEADSGYWHSSESDMHWDPVSGGFFSRASGSWYGWNPAAQTFEAWTV